MGFNKNIFSNINHRPYLYYVQPALPQATNFYVFLPALDFHKI